MFLVLTHRLEIAASCPLHKPEARILLLEGEWTVSDFVNWKGHHSCAGAAGMSVGTSAAMKINSVSLDVTEPGRGIRSPVA